jgi:hypothetical protein
MGKSLIFASVYMPKDEDIRISCDKISNICGISHSRNILVASDSNAKGSLWRSPISDVRGDHLTELIFELDLIILNNSNVPTFWRTNGESFIDVTIASQSIANFVYNWRVADEETLSDHNYITFELNFISSAVYHTAYNDFRYNTKFANWDSFKTSILNNYSNSITYKSPKTPQEIDLTISELNQLINKACNSSMKLKKKILNARPWWSPEIESQRHTVRNKRRRYQRCNNSTLREIRRKDYLTEKYKYKKLIKNARNKSWREFV